MSSKKILVFGDSLTEGWIDGGKKFYPYTNILRSLLKTHCTGNFNVINSGLSGETVYKQMYERLQNMLLQHAPVDLLILQGGTNDILLNKDFNSTKNLFDEFHKLIDLARENGVKKTCALTIMEGKYTSADDAVLTHDESNNIRISFNQQLLDFVYQSKHSSLFCCDMATKFPYFSLDENEQKKYWDDFIHPSVAGYNKMGEIIFKDIEIML